MSTLIPTASGLPAARSEAAVSSSASRPRAMTATRAPSVARISATARPIPLLPPVTTAVASASPRSTFVLLRPRVHQAIMRRHRRFPDRERTAGEPGRAPARSPPGRRSADRASPAGAIRPAGHRVGATRRRTRSPIRSKAARERADRVHLEVGKRHVGESLVANPVPEVHGSRHGQPPTIELFGPELERIVAVAAPAPAVVDQAADGAEHLGRVAVAPQEPGVRVRLEQGVQREHVHRRLEVPQAWRAVPLQQAQHAAVIAVGPTHVALRSPTPDRTGTRPKPSKCTVRKLMPSRSWHSVAVVASWWCMRLHEGEHLVHHREPGLGVRDAGVAVLGGRLRRGAR